MILGVALQLRPKVVEGEVRDGYAAGHVLQVEHFLLERLELLAAVFQVVHLVVALAFEHVLLAGRAGIEQRHATFHAPLQLDVLVELDVRPEVHQLDRSVGRPQAVDAPEALDDAHGVPVDVVVHQAVAVLQVLALGDAVRGEEDVNLAELPARVGEFLGHWREVREHRVERGALDLE